MKRTSWSQGLSVTTGGSGVVPLAGAVALRRDFGLITGQLPAGSRNVISDVAGVTVGHYTNPGPNLSQLSPPTSKRRGMPAPPTSSWFEVTEESLYDALFTAETVTGRDGNTLHALPPEKVAEIIRKYRNEAV